MPVAFSQGDFLVLYNAVFFCSASGAKDGDILRYGEAFYLKTANGEVSIQNYLEYLSNI